MRKDPRFNYVISVSDACDVPSAQLVAFRVPHFTHVYPNVSVPVLDSEYDDAAQTACERELDRQKLTAREVEQYFDELLDRGIDAIIHIAPHSAFSEEYVCCKKAAGNELIKYPRRNVYVVDGKAFSSGLKPLVELAIRLKDEGRTAEETYLALVSAAETVQTYYVTTTPEYPHRNGKLAALAQGTRTATIMKLTDSGNFEPVKRAPAATAVKWLAKAAVEQNYDKLYVSAAKRDHLTLFNRNLAQMGVETDLSRAGLYALSALGSGALSVAFWKKSAQTEQNDAI